MIWYDDDDFFTDRNLNLVLRSCEKTCTIGENISKQGFKIYYQSNKLKNRLHG